MALPHGTWLLGIDAGGSRTRALRFRVGQPDSLRRGEAGPANWTTQPLAACHDAVVAAATAAEAPPGFPLAALCVAAAGYSPGLHADAAAAALSACWPSARLRLETDLVGAWAGAFGGEPGIVAVCGTGSVAYGRNAKGEAARAGGWGPVIDDRGSGYWLGCRMLEAVARTIDGRGHASALVAALTEVTGDPDPERAIRRLHREERPQIARLAEQVIACAVAGDPIARALVEEAASALAELAVAVERRLRDVRRLALVGGVAAGGGEALARAVRDRLARHGSRLVLRPPARDAATGALLLAAEALAGDAGRHRLRDELAWPRSCEN